MKDKPNALSPAKHAQITETEVTFENHANEVLFLELESTARQGSLCNTLRLTVFIVGLVGLSHPQ